MAFLSFVYVFLLANAISFSNSKAQLSYFVSRTGSVILPQEYFAKASPVVYGGIISSLVSITSRNSGMIAILGRVTMPNKH